MDSIVVHEDGTELHYLDSGPPSDVTYPTIFAVHGIAFSSPIFQRVSAISRNAGIRFVSINRRGYKGSTPLLKTDLDIFTQGTDVQKFEWLKSRGLEISNFMNSFIVRENLPAITPEGKGGCVLLAWSMGSCFTMPAIAYISDLPSPVRARLASHLRAYILHEPPAIALGLPTLPNHMLGLGPEISEEAKSRIFISWLTSYFQHSGFTTRDFHGLDAAPSIIRVPSLWNMSLTEATDIIDPGPCNTFDFPLLYSLQSQSNAIYKAVMLDGAARDELPHMKIWLAVGDASVPFCVSVLWYVQDDDKTHGGNVNYKVLHGKNHFVHWDEPDFAVDTYIEML